MPDDETISLSLPPEILRIIRRKVSSGEYASDAEVVSDGLRVLAARDSALEAFLRDEVATSIDDYRNGTAITVPAREVRESLDARHSERTGKSPTR